MKKIILFLFGMVLMSSMVFAASFTWSAPDVTPGSTFAITATTTDAVGSNFGYLITADIDSGGCVFDDGSTHLSFGATVPNPAPYSVAINAIAPSIDGTCDVSGQYRITDGAGEGLWTDFSDLTISVTGGGCTPATTCGAWGAWSDSANQCGERTRTCNDGCGGTDYTDTDTQSCNGGGGSSTSCGIFEKEKNGSCEFNATVGIVIGILIFAVVLLRR